MAPFLSIQSWGSTKSSINSQLHIPHPCFRASDYCIISYWLPQHFLVFIKYASVVALRWAVPSINLVGCKLWRHLCWWYFMQKETNYLFNLIITGVFQVHFQVFMLFIIINQLITVYTMKHFQYNTKQSTLFTQKNI